MKINFKTSNKKLNILNPIKINKNPLNKDDISRHMHYFSIFTIIVFFNILNYILFLYFLIILC